MLLLTVKGWNILHNIFFQLHLPFTHLNKIIRLQRASEANYVRIPQQQTLLYKANWVVINVATFTATS